MTASNAVGRRHVKRPVTETHPLHLVRQEGRDDPAAYREGVMTPYHYLAASALVGLMLWAIAALPPRALSVWLLPARQLWRSFLLTAHVIA
jgi:hypothetical protein